MSRSGYSDDDIDNWQLIKYRGQVASAIRGKRGQALLKDLLKALDAMPVKELIANELVCSDGVCALGALAQARAMNISDVDPENIEYVASIFDIAPQLAMEIVYMNDEAGWYNEAPATRYARVRKWVARQIKPEVPAQPGSTPSAA